MICFEKKRQNKIQQDYPSTKCVLLGRFILIFYHVYFDNIYKGDFHPSGGIDIPDPIEFADKKGPLIMIFR